MSSPPARPSWHSARTTTRPATPTFYAVPYKSDLKSLVWYSPDNFADAGYDVPETFEDLMTLTDKIVADGKTPWCIGLGSGGATGWPATDWIEDLMLRTQSPEDYDAWVSNDLKFNDPKVVEALELFGSIAKDDKKVAGGTAAVGTTDFRESPLGLFAVPPACYMHHQASFIPSFFPEGTVLGEDADFFYFPAYAGKDLGKPVLGAGVEATITKDSPAAHAFIDFLMNPISNEIWMAQSGFLSAMKAANVETYGNDTLQGRRRNPAQRHDLPLRRIRSDAGRGGCRLVLDRHGRLRRRQVRPGSCRRHPGQLGRREVTTD